MKECVLALVVGISFILGTDAVVAQDFHSGAHGRNRGSQGLSASQNNPQLQNCLGAASSEEESTTCRQQFSQSRDWRQQLGRPQPDATATPIPEPTVAIQVPESDAEGAVPMY